MNKGALISTCEQYRYAAWRVWDQRKDRVAFIGLAPSNADAIENDSFIQRGQEFAQQWGFGGAYFVNLFALRGAGSKDIKNAADPVGEVNDEWIAKYCNKAHRVIAAWGNDGNLHGRATTVVPQLPSLYCVSKNKSGHPANLTSVAAHLKSKRYKPSF